METCVCHAIGELHVFHLSVGTMQMCCAQRCHIISCVKQGKTQDQTFRLLQEVYGEDSLSRSTCRRWYLRAQMGDSSGKDLEHPGQQPSVWTLATVRDV